MSVIEERKQIEKDIKSLKTDLRKVLTTTKDPRLITGLIAEIERLRLLLYTYRYRN